MAVSSKRRRTFWKPSPFAQRPSARRMKILDEAFEHSFPFTRLSGLVKHSLSELYQVMMELLTRRLARDAKTRSTSTHQRRHQPHSQRPTPLVSPCTSTLMLRRSLIETGYPNGTVPGLLPNSTGGKRLPKAPTSAGNSVQASAVGLLGALAVLIAAF